MRLFRNIETFLLTLVNAAWCFFVKIHEKKNIRKKVKLYTKVCLTAEQKHQIDEFYQKNYGKKVPYKWHQLYQSYTGKFDYKYIPEYIFSTELEPINNKRYQVLPLENKALLSNFNRGMEGKVRIPETYITCVQDKYYDRDGNIIDRNKAIEYLKLLYGGCYMAICKKTVDTSSGRDVRLLDMVNGIDQRENETIDGVLDSMGHNFIIQEKINAHPKFCALYSGSINTLRLISYQTKTEYKVAPIIMRIGRSGFVDNAHAGGMFIGVSPEGRLEKTAFTEYQESFEKHPVTNIVFDGYMLPRVSDVIDVAIEMHKKYPSMRFISWDFTIDENGDIVLIEANLHSQAVWVSQMAHGKSFFGEDTAEMLQLVSKKRNS